MDVISGFWVFIASFSFIQMILLEVFIYIYDNSLIEGFGSTMTSMFVIWGILFGAEAGIFTLKHFLITFVPVANLFWASMIPSIWLWAYVIAALVTRMLLASRPLFRKLVGFLDVNEHPIRSIGIVAAAAMAMGSGVIVLTVAVI
jgi:CBS domain containing-hemolysin-like protein